jgi:hypothetical protein
VSLSLSNYFCITHTLSLADGTRTHLTPPPQILRGRLQELEAKTAALERQRGVAGYQQTQSRLEDVSAKKSEVDEGKERMLGEISRVVQDINQQIKARPLSLSMSLSLCLTRPRRSARAGWRR